jgi:hypothetical protein
VRANILVRRCRARQTPRNSGNEWSPINPLDRKCVVAFMKGIDFATSSRNQGRRTAIATNRESDRQPQRYSALQHLGLVKFLRIQN